MGVEVDGMGGGSVGEVEVPQKLLVGLFCS